GFFAAVALLLATFGVYGLLSYVVAQRRGEIGIRMALGARRSDVIGLVLRQGAALVIGGVAVGLLAAAATTSILEGFLFGVSTDDRLTFAVVTVVLMTVALVACWFPAQRAARVDPMQVLRLE
ncbi:MAG: FtsX-like permease family protein, partial [Acidobacteria bacterium]|nr:FtsX-like permease family protein [Acidobacteriota bacterium]